MIVGLTHMDWAQRGDVDTSQHIWLCTVRVVLFVLYLSVARCIRGLCGKNTSRVHIPSLSTD